MLITSLQQGSITHQFQASQLSVIDKWRDICQIVPIVWSGGRSSFLKMEKATMMCADKANRFGTRPFVFFPLMPRRGACLSLHRVFPPNNVRHTPIWRSASPGPPQWTPTARQKDYTKTRPRLSQSSQRRPKQPFVIIMFIPYSYFCAP